MNDATVTAIRYGANDPRGPPGGGNVTLIAGRTGNLYAFSAGLAVTTGRDTTSVGGSISVTRLLGTTEAILDSVDGSAIDGDVTLAAVDTAETLAIGGGVAVSVGKGATGFGGAFALNQMINTTRAAVLGTRSRSKVGAAADGASSLTLVAKNDNTIRSIAVSVGVAVSTSVSPGFGFAATIAVNLITNDPLTGRESKVEAAIENADVYVSGAVGVTAQDDSTIQSIGGAVGVGVQESGFGFAIGFDMVATKTTARIESASVRGGSVSVEAKSTQSDDVLDGKILAVSVGAGISAGSGNGGAAGGALSVNVLNSEIRGESPARRRA